MYKSTKDKAVLIAHESLKLRNQLMAPFKQNNMLIEQAMGASHVLHMIETRRYTMLLLDEKFQDLQAHELIDLIRRNFPKEDLPILLMCRDPHEPKTKELFKLGANDFVLKNNNINKNINLWIKTNIIF